jgi:hypothetical protein
VCSELVTWSATHGGRITRPQLYHLLYNQVKYTTNKCHVLRSIRSLSRFHTRAVHFVLGSRGPQWSPANPAKGSTAFRNSICSLPGQGKHSLPEFNLQPSLRLGEFIHTRGNKSMWIQRHKAAEVGAQLLAE